MRGALWRPVPPPDPAAVARYEYAQAPALAAQTQRLYDTYHQWELAGTVPQPRRLFGTLGKGEFSTVVAAREGDIAIRTPEEAWRVEEYVSGLVRGLDIPCLEQIQAASKTKTYAGIIRGAGRGKVTIDMLDNLTLWQLREALEAFTLMEARQLGVDAVGDNMNIGPQGIGILDYTIKPDQIMADKVGTLTQLLARPRRTYTKAAYRKELRGRHAAVQKLGQVVAEASAIYPDYWARSIIRVKDVYHRTAELAGMKGLSM